MKNNKKNWILRLGAVALMLTMVTTCLLGNTLAKYVTEASGTDTARVAKFGVEIEMSDDLDGAFKSEYETDDSDHSDIITYSVSSANGTDKVVAPGTEGSFDIKITGTPEVAVEIEFELLDAAYSDNWVVDGGSTYGADYTYHPILWTLQDANGSGIYSGANLGDLADALESLNRAYAPNVDLSSVETGTCTLSWVWPFEVDEDHNYMDTQLGDLAVDEDLTVSLELSVRVTQIN